MTRTPQHEKLPTIVEPLEPRRPSKGDIEAALSVLDFYLKSPDASQIHPRTPFEDVIHALQNTLKAPSRAQNHDTTVPSVTQATRGSRSKRKCYICQFLLVSNHPQYSSLCNPCGEFNLASCALSLPENLSLNGKTALVTGARVNLGYSHSRLKSHPTKNPNFYPTTLYTETTTKCAIYIESQRRLQIWKAKKCLMSKPPLKSTVSNVQRYETDRIANRPRWRSVSPSTASASPTLRNEL